MCVQQRDTVLKVVVVVVVAASNVLVVPSIRLFSTTMDTRGIGISTQEESNENMWRSRNGSILATKATLSFTA